MEPFFWANNTRPDPRLKCFVMLAKLYFSVTVDVLSRWKSECFGTRSCSQYIADSNSHDTLSKNMLANQKTTRPYSSIGAIKRAMIKVRYCVYTRTHGQGYRSKHATTTAPWARYKGQWLRFAIVSIPEHIARVIGQNALPTQLRGRGTNGDD